MDKHLIGDASNVISNLKELNQRFSGKTILLTGFSGFLGSHFVYYFLSLNDRKILDKPCHIFAWDNFHRGLPHWLKILCNRNDISINKGDITKDIVFCKSDFVIHAASIASPTFYRKYPLETMDANVIGLRNLLEFCKTNPTESFIFFSSSEVYGDPNSENIPTSEEYNGNVSCIGPRACYDESKRYGETLCVNFFRSYNIPVKIIRPFNNYGPGLKITDRRVIPDFFRNVHEDQDIILFSDGTATRTFCYVSDAIEGYLRVLLSDHNGEAFNIGSDKPEISIRDLARMIVEISGKELNTVHKISNDSKYLIDNPNRRCPSIIKAKKLLNFRTTVGLVEGLKRTYQFYQDYSTGSDD